MQNTYETIETLGLAELNAALPFPSESDLRHKMVQESFEAIFAPMIATGLEAEIEPLAHGFTSAFFKRKQAISSAIDKKEREMKNLIHCADGSEVLETQLEQAQSEFVKLRDILAAVEQLAEAAANCYEIQTSKAFVPPAGSRLAAQAHKTGAVFEAQALLDAAEKEKAEKLKVKAKLAIAVAGDRDWPIDQTKTIWQKLDQIRAHCRNKYAEEICLYTKADRIGVDAIACAWARSRKIEIVTFKPNWSAHAKRAGFLAVDAMLSDKNAQELAGVAIFGSSGIAMNLGQKAEAREIKAIYVKPQDPS